MDSILIQTRLPDEVIIADDGSGDDIAQVATGFLEIAPFPVFHVWHEDKGFRAAKIRNEAIKKATGEYIVILDGDCIPNRHFMYDHMALAEEGFFVQGKRVLLSEKVSTFFTAQNANSFLYLSRLVFSNSVSNSHHLLRIPFFPPVRSTKLRGTKSCNMGFYRKDMLAVNGFNEEFIGWGREDSELAARLFNYGVKRKEHPFVAICFHLWHPPYPVDTLVVNDVILQRTINGRGYFCVNGIIKK